MGIEINDYLCSVKSTGSDARVVEEARLESVYTPKAYRGFESPLLRKVMNKPSIKRLAYLFYRNDCSANKETQ